MRCPTCDTEHELLEPSFRRPDVVFAMDADERKGVRDGDDFCAIPPRPGSEARFFLRTVLPVRLTDHDAWTQWGLWVEVSEEDARCTWDLWDSPEQATAPPFPGRIANEIAGYPTTIGLPVSVQLTGPTTRPKASIPPDTVHPFADECRRGVATV